jgi:hypothetical protein
VAFQCTIVHLEREIHFLERQQSTAAHFERFGTGRREQSGRKIAVAPPARFYSRLSPICSLAYPPPRLGVRFWKVLEGCVDELCSLRARSTRSGRARSTRSGATGWKRVVLRATVSESRHLLHERVSRRAGISGFRVQGSGFSERQG